MSFTPNQQQVIDHDGHLLVVAGPGSGKTTTSVSKAQRILADASRSLIMVTFTKEGAIEMRRRLDAAQARNGASPYPDERLVIATFHSIALRHLQRHKGRFRLLSPAQQNIMIGDAMSALRLDLDAQKDVRQEFESYMYAVDRTKVELSPTANELVNRYQSRMRASGQIDLYTVMRDCALMADSGDIPPLPFTDMLVDEGQDTDELQKVWIFAHARAGVRVTIVGDDDQSIYEWRHALGYSGMKSFLEAFSARRIELGDNFRCRAEILTHAVLLIEKNKERLGKKLVARRGKGGSIWAHHTPGAVPQAQTLAQLIAATPHQHSNSAILARTNRSLDALEFQLRKRGITYTRIGKSIWDHDLVAGYLMLLQSLLDTSTVGLLGALRHQPISEEAKNELLVALGGDAASFLDGNVPKLTEADSEDRKTIKALASACRYWRTWLSRGSVDEVVSDVGQAYASWLKPTRAKELIESCAGTLADLKGTLSSRLRMVTQPEQKDTENTLILMTMHGSKGLEFETVHIVDANKPETGATPAEEEAERRLMYVAITRAKDRCGLWYSGAPHPTLDEARIPRVHQFDEVVKAIERV